MIVPMRKAHIATRADQRDALLTNLSRIGVVHLTPVGSQRVVADEEVRQEIDRLARAIQLLEQVHPVQPPAELPAERVAETALEIERRAAEQRQTLVQLHRELEQISVWGDLRLEQIDALRGAGVDVRFYLVPRNAVDQVQADCLMDVAPAANRTRLVAVATRDGAVELPAGSVPVPLPARDAPTIKAEAAKIQEQLHADQRLLGQLAPRLPDLRAELARLQRQAAFTAARRSGLEDGDLFAVRGWVPEDAVETLPAELERAGVPAAVELIEPEPDEEPPTLLRSPKLVRPIRGMLDLLGTVPGYREFDLSAPFMIALPIFTAILISDGGYGLLLMLAPLLFYRFVARQLGGAFTQLLIVVGGAALLWGLLCGSFFGVTLYTPYLPVDLSERSRTLLMHLSFTIGAIHLSLAQLWQAAHYWPDLRAVSKVGWALFIWGMYGVVRMFVLRGPLGWDTPWPFLLIAGAVLAIVFHKPSRNVVAMIAVGIANFPLSMLSAFSDVISYVRLMAVGLASAVLATSFNELAADMPHQSVAVLVLVFGHSLNVGLVLIAMFAHGVRLNMLEFATNLGMQWTGYPYNPFGEATAEEQKA
jgi:V/A-type H+-transporting ATPase subunit I